MTNTYGTRAGGYGSTPAGTPDPSGRFSFAPARRKRLFRWGAGITLAGFLAGGGIALAAVYGSSGGTAGASTQASQEAATLNSALSTAADNSSTTSPPRLRWALGRLRLLGGVDGTITFHNKTGFHTVSFERGTIVSVSGGDVVIKAADGTTWTWAIVSDTVVRKNGSKTTTSALSAGETVFAGGPVVNGARDARLILIRAAGSSGSGSAQTSLS